MRSICSLQEINAAKSLLSDKIEKLTDMASAGEVLSGFEEAMQTEQFSIDKAQQPLDVSSFRAEENTEFNTASHMFTPFDAPKEKGTKKRNRVNKQRARIVTSQSASTTSFMVAFRRQERVSIRL